ncbi:MAG: fibrobacter succinogenes major paralogous domain-containing protein [Anditalea sp.]
MKNLTASLIFSFLIWSCSQLDSNPSKSGEVRFKAVSVKPFTGSMPHGRIEAASAWKHIFKREVRMKVINKNTGQAHYVDLNPNDFGDGFKLTLPIGSYTYFAEVEGGDYEEHLPFLIEGEFNLNSETMDITLMATTDYGLITVKNEFVRSLGIRHESTLLNLALSEDDSHYFIYAKKGLTPKLEIEEIFEKKLIEGQVAVQAYSHYHFFLKFAQSSGDVNFIDLALGEFELIEEGIGIGEQAAKGTFTDPRDGQTYKTVRINEQIWMTENLNYATEDSWCYDNDPVNCARYGRLYERLPALTACPDGWHLPTEEEWRLLVTYLGGVDVAGGKMKSTTGDWFEPNTGATNESGFTGLPGGFSFVDNVDREYFARRGEGFWWSSTELRLDGDNYIYIFSLGNASARSRLSFLKDGSPDESFHSVTYSCRCVKD